MVIRVKKTGSFFTDRQPPSVEPPTDVPTTASFWTPNRAYLPLVATIQEVKRSSLCPVTIAFTSALPGEGVTYIVDELNNELTRQTHEKTATVRTSELRDDSKLDTILQHEDKTTSTRRRWKSDAPENWETKNFSPIQQRFDELGKRFDYVLIDCPSLKHSDDALVLGKHCTGVCLVVAAGKTTKMQIQGALTTFALAAIPIFGLVLNKRTYPVPDFIYKRL